MDCNGDLVTLTFLVGADFKLANSKYIHFPSKWALSRKVCAMGEHRWSFGISSWYLFVILGALQGPLGAFLLGFGAPDLEAPRALRNVWGGRKCDKIGIMHEPALPRNGLNLFPALHCIAQTCA